MALNFLRPGIPGMQPVGDRCTAKSAILIGAVNGLVSPPYLQRCLCAGRRCDGDAEQRYYQLANFVVAMLGVALLVVDMALSLTVISSPRWPRVVRWMVWLTKVLVCGALQLGVNVLYFCIKMVCARLMLV
ncbi:hypothetical protein BAE44_0006849 [Dichanthelium oligosanthes]|uniref:Uncharacterized protein n=1 Tax=Dichanthelium oligosanthes TaxID=888268 RepID=A0A1E5W3Y3_9POAL|nr:hypothetical protein BAE44_0006849 [Dichanthelium oligosanthes]